MRMDTKKQNVLILICRTACFYIGSSSLCSRYLIPLAPLQHCHKALFADVALHEIIVCGEQEAASVLQSRHGVEHEISPRRRPETPKNADFHRFFPEEQRRVLVGFASTARSTHAAVGRAHIPAHCTAQSGADAYSFPADRRKPSSRHTVCRFQFTDVVKIHIAFPPLFWSF